MIRLTATVVFVASIICAWAEDTPAKPGAKPTIYDHIHKKGDLPTGGQFVLDPKNQHVQYYFTNRQLMWPDKTNAQKHSGLYASDDAGANWKLRCYTFEFDYLFIHPDTGKLYAIIQYVWLDKSEDGFLTQYRANKALMSDDGRRWKDITGGRGHVAELYGIEADPDHRGRVCLRAATLRPYVLQAVDDNYSEWTWHGLLDWAKRQEKQENQQPAKSDGARRATP